MTEPIADSHDRMPDGPVDTAWFAAPICRNCGVSRDTPFCGGCGQKAARRFAWRELGRETWERLRLFELKSVRTVGRLLLSPGTVAREYVLGRRTAYMHPLTLLIALVALLVLVLAAGRYFEVYGVVDRDGDVNRMAQRVMAYANWSFSLGIIAIFAASAIVFRRRLGYNLIEHAVLSVYCQNVILAIIVVNLLPTLIWRDPAFILWHKQASFYYVSALKLLVVGVGYKQFFLAELRTDWLELALACVVFAILSWALLRVYAFAILWIVSR